MKAIYVPPSPRSSPSFKRPVQGAAIPGRERPVPGEPESKDSEPVVHVCLPTQKEIYKNVLTNQLACLGIVPVLSDHVPAGRLEDNINTWKVITRDLWVLDTIWGYQIDFLADPYQRAVPPT